MLAYALYVFVAAFIVVAATGHVLLLAAIYPNLFGTPQAERNSAGDRPELGRGEPPAQTPKLAA